MDRLLVSVGPCVIHFRPGRPTINVSEHMLEALNRMRAALIATAMVPEAKMTYTQLEAATGRAYFRRAFGEALDVLSVDCLARSEPPLSALVVHKRGDGEVGAGFILGDPVQIRADLYAFWHRRGQGQSLSDATPEEWDY